MEEEELHYPCSENKDADQLRRNCEADLRLCFRLGENLIIFTLIGENVIIFA